MNSTWMPKDGVPEFSTETMQVAFSSSLTGAVTDMGAFIGANCGFGVSGIGGTFETGDSVEDVGLDAGTPTVTGFSVCKYPVGTVFGVAVL
jgi:hypothetical protein